MIRIATVEDAGTLARLGRETYREHFASLWSDAGMRTFLDRDFSTEALHASLASSAHAWLIAGTDTQTAAFAKLNWRRPEPLTGVIGTELQKLYCLAAATGHGHGSRLLAAALRLVAERDAGPLWLGVLDTNLGARRFYERHGFREVGVMPFATDLQSMRMIVMRQNDA